MTESPTFSSEIDRATTYCTYCPKMCRFSCPAAEAEHRETATPWGMMRLFEFAKKGHVEPSDEVAEAFYHCMGCRRCREWCRHDNDVPEAMWAARAWMRDMGHIPEPLEGFTADFLRHNNPHGAPSDLAEIHGFDVDGVFDDEATIVYLPDCETREHEPENVVRAGLLLEIFNGAKVRLHTRRVDEGEGPTGHGCCGFPLLSAGADETYDCYRAELDATLEDAELVVAECPAMVALHRDESSWGEATDLEVVHLVEFLEERLDFVEPRESISCEGAMLHDACFTSRQLDLSEEVRNLVGALCDDEPEEFQFSGDKAPCCGGPSHYHLIAPDASERCAEKRIEEMEREDGEQIIATAATCKKAFCRAGDDDTATDLLDLVCRAFGL